MHHKPPSKWFDQVFLKENSLKRGDKGDGGSSANEAARSGDLLAFTAPGDQSRAKSLSNQQAGEESREITTVNK